MAAATCRRNRAEVRPSLTRLKSVLPPQVWGPSLTRWKSALAPQFGPVLE